MSKEKIMKKIQPILLFLPLFFLVTACEKNIKVYDGENNIYFLHAVSSVFLGAASADSLDLTFAYTPGKTDSVLKVPVRITGSPSDKDRAFKVAISPSSTAVAGKHYEPLPANLRMRAGRVTDTIFVRFIRTPDMLADTLSLILELQPNENFATHMTDKVVNTLTGQKQSFTKFTINVTDVLSRPKLWLDTYLGTFSRKKILLMNEVTGMPLDALNNTTTTVAQVIYWGKFTQRYLNDKKATGQTVYEDNGTEMIMGPSVQ